MKFLILQPFSSKEIVFDILSIIKVPYAVILINFNKLITIAGKYYFTRDPRLKMNIPNMFSQEQIVRDAEQIKTPIFIAKCKESSYYEPKENFYKVLDVVKRTSPDCDFHYVSGKHHAHLCNPEVMSDLINSFIARHNSADRTIGGLQGDFIKTI